MKDEVWLSALLLRKIQEAVLEASCITQVAITINYFHFPSPHHGPASLMPGSIQSHSGEILCILPALRGLHC